MALSASITESYILSALRAMILTVVDCEVIRTPVNRTAMPKGDFIALTPIGKMPLSIGHDAYSIDTRTASKPIQFIAQIDCYGPNSGNNSLLLMVFLRDSYAFENMQYSGISPLFATDAHQIPIVDGENQYQERWTFQAHLQVVPAVTLPQETMA